MKKLISVFLVIALTFGGCSLKGTKQTDSMPEDTPWNREIMETDSGYYYGSQGDVMSLKYTEKSNGTDIFLCAKPECTHTGEDTCTATYKYLTISNYILYEGNIYFAAETPDEETQGVSLYKASLDGSSLDKVCDVRRVKYKTENKNTDGMLVSHSQSECNFIIHKGYAYIPYFLGDTESAQDVVETGWAKVDIQTGDVQIIDSDNTFQARTEYTMIAGVGDCIYYTVYATNWGKYGFYRYNIKDGKSEKITGELGELVSDKSGHYGLSGITENAAYIIHLDTGINELTGYDLSTFEKNGLSIEMDPKDMSNCFCFYDGKIFRANGSEIMIYSEKGELLGSNKWYNAPDNEKEFILDIYGLNINEGKLYIKFMSNMELKGMDFDKSSKTDYGYELVYCCPINDVIAGKGIFAKAYEVK